MKTGVIDIGNTALKAGIFEGNLIVDFAYSPEINTLENFFSGVDRLIVGSVAGVSVELRDALKNFDVIFWNKSTDNVNLPFDILCDYSQTIGIDRLALIAGAQALYPKENILVISLGTCVTYNIFRSDGNFIPGAISAGLSMRLRAMHRDASALPLVEPELLNSSNLCVAHRLKLGHVLQYAPSSLHSCALTFEFLEVPKNTNISMSTEMSMLNGSIIGLWYEIQGYINQYSKTYENLKILLTGGDLKYYEQCVSESLCIFASPNLVLQGLNEILRHNKK